MAAFTVPIFGDTETDNARVCYAEDLRDKLMFVRSTYTNIRKFPNYHVSKGSIVLKSLDQYLINKAFIILPTAESQIPNTYHPHGWEPEKHLINELGTLTGLFWDMPDGRWHYCQLNHQLLPWAKDGNFANNLAAKPTNKESEFYGLDNSFCFGFVREDTIINRSDVAVFDEYPFIVLRENAAIKTKERNKKIALIGGALTAALGLFKEKALPSATGGVAVAYGLQNDKMCVSLVAARVMRIVKKNKQSDAHITLGFRFCITNLKESFTVNSKISGTITHGAEVYTIDSDYNLQSERDITLQKYEKITPYLVIQVMEGTQLYSDVMNAGAVVWEWTKVTFSCVLSLMINGAKQEMQFSSHLSEMSKRNTNTFLSENITT